MTLTNIGLPLGGLRRALLCVPFAAFIACSASEDTGGGQGGAAHGGASNAQGGQQTTPQGGAAQGGQTTSTGGNSNGNGGASNGGSSNGTGGSSNGGSSNGGSTAAGASNGGSSNGGSTNGGGSNGGSSNGGVAGSGNSNGGAAGAGTAGSSSKGGATSGGATGSGGTTGTGGNTSGGSSNGGACDVWIAPTGTATNPGTEAAPADLAHGYDLLCPPPPSGSGNGTPCQGTLKTICAKAGTYTMTTRFEFKKTRMGTASRVLTLQAAPNAATRPLFDFSTQPRITSCGAAPSDGNEGGFTVNADYVTIRGIEVKGANDNCIKVQGSHDTLDNVAVHDCADTGIQISAGSGYTGSGTNNLILNCDSYHNYDPQCNGENADGFGAKEATGAGNIFRGCRSWENVDDGYDFYAWLSPVRLENCWSWSNAKTISAAEQDGNGFKLGGDNKGGNHVLVDSIAVSNRMRGFTNNSGANSTCTGCRSCSNAQADTGVSGITSSGCPSTSQLAGARAADGSLPSVP